MSLVLWKLFKWPFLKKGRKCPPHEQERRKGRPARAGEQYGAQHSDSPQGLDHTLLGLAQTSRPTLVNFPK